MPPGELELFGNVVPGENAFPGLTGPERDAQRGGDLLERLFGLARFRVEVDLEELVEEDDRAAGPGLEQERFYERARDRVLALQEGPSSGRRLRAGVRPSECVDVEDDRVDETLGWRLVYVRRGRSHTQKVKRLCLTLLAFRWVTSTTCGDSPSLTVRVTNIFTGITCPPTFAAHPSPKTRLHSTAPSAESIPYSLP